MAPKILVVDWNQAFATMLKEMLESDGDYEVVVAQAGTDALALLREADFDLTIVDMDLDPEDMEYRELVQNVRQVQPAMRLMLIPLMGEELPGEARELDIQGTLSKPFFVDDLLPSIREALVKEVRPPGFRPLEAPEPVGQAALAEQAAPDVQSVLLELARETSADAVVLVSTAADAQRVVAHASTLDRAAVEKLAELGVATVRAARATARFLGQPNEPFEHNMFESKALRLYIMALLENFLFVIVTPVSIPLGTVRHNLRRASRDLANLALT